MDDFSSIEALRLGIATGLASALIDNRAVAAGYSSLVPLAATQPGATFEIPLDGDGDPLENPPIYWEVGDEVGAFDLAP